jgi:uncharacterized protein (TIGR02996 family)
MTDRDALYRAILAHPEDDTPRLVYADWLEENGRSEEAEFIRVECRLEAGAPDDDDHVELLDRREELRLWLRANVPGPQAKLQAGLRIEDGSDWWRMTHRGFPRFIAYTGHSARGARPIRPLSAALENAFARYPTRWLVVNFITVAQLGEILKLPALAALDHLTVQLHPSEEARDDACQLISDCPHLRNLRGLFLSFTLGDVGLSSLARSENAGNLRSLSLAHCAACTPSSVRALGAAAWFRRLNQIQFHELDEAAFQELCRLDPLPGLHTLELGDASYSTTSWRRFAQSKSFPRLVSLRNGTEMSAGRMEGLAEAAGLRLVALNLSSCGIGNDGAEALARAPWLDSLRWLDLSYNRLTASGVAAIGGSRRLNGLQFLDLSFNNPGIGGLRAIAANPALRGLTTLLLRGSPDHADLKPAHLYEILATLKMPNLRRLGLSDQPLGAIGAGALEAEKYRNLTRLQIARCRLDDAAIDRLLTTAPFQQQLVELDVSQNEIRTGVTRLTDRRVMPRLSAATFSGNRIAADLLRRLKRRFGRLQV